MWWFGYFPWSIMTHHECIMTHHECIMNINGNFYLVNHMIQKGIIWTQMMIHFIICDHHMMIIRGIHHDKSWTIMISIVIIMMIMMMFMMIMMLIMMVHDWSWSIMMIMTHHDWSKNSLTHWTEARFCRMELGRGSKIQERSILFV